MVTRRPPGNVVHGLVASVVVVAGAGDGDGDGDGASAIWLGCCCVLRMLCVFV